MVMPPQQKALRKVLREQPCSTHRLTQEAGVPYSNVIEARDGTRPVSAGMASKLIDTLRKWAADIDRLADELEAAMEGGTDE